MTDTQLVLKDMQNKGPQGSWDWEADHRFAKAVGDLTAVSDLERIMACELDAAAFIGHKRLVRKRITERRLRALRKLVAQGTVYADWRGTGPGGKNRFGVNRCRAYFLKEEN